MDNDKPLAVVMTTIDDADGATSLAHDLVDRRFAACVQIVPITSHYVWDGETRHDQEQLLLIKTPESKVGDLMAWLDDHHPYDTPEIVALKASAVSDGYLAWAVDQTG